MRAPARRAGRIGRLALALFYVAALVQGLRATAGLAGVARGARSMCEGLPDYATVARELPLDARVEVEVDRAEARAGERFVCARLALAPRAVVAGAADGTPPEGAPATHRLFDLGGVVRIEEAP